MKKIGLLFGAGAEIAYGLPSGGKLALDIFRTENSGKKEFEEIIKSKVNPRSKYVKDWLPHDYQSKLISSFGKTEYKQIIDSTFENKRNNIIEFLKIFDKKAKALVNSKDFIAFNINKCFENITGEKPDDYFINNDVEINAAFNDQVNLFESSYFSLLLKVIQEKGKDTVNLIKIVKAFLELWVGAVGKEYIQSLNTNMFSRKKDDFSMDIFNEFTDFFSFNSRHITCLDILYNNTIPECHLDSTDYIKITYFASSLLTELLQSSIDYQELVDSYYNYLYKPKLEWSKFCKISTFLYGVQKYIKKGEKDYKEKAKIDGYYFDLKELLSAGNELHIGTTNYNHLIEENIENEVYYLNGSVEDYYDPYQNKILTKAENSISNHITVPLLFTQSGIKPITSVSMTLRYSEYYKHLCESDIIAVIGFGFNSDDGHVNCLFRELVLQNKKIIIFDYGNNGKNYYLEKLRLDGSDEDYKELIVLPIDGERKSNGESWYKILIKELK